MPVQLTTIARNTFIEAIRQPIFFVIVAICGIAQLFLTWTAAFSMSYSDSAEVSGDNKFLLDLGLSTVFVCGVILAAFIATAVVSREIENKTVLTVVSKPVARPTVIFGKYLGIAGSMILAIIPMLIFLYMGLRHGVLSTAADTLDQPVITFTFLALAVITLVSLWCNFFYGWYFTQTFMLLLAPAMTLAYIAVLLLSKKWHFQPIATDFKPQITFASIAMTMALLVLTAVATAVSTRLGQVMTIVICGGIFLFGLLSNYLIGRHAFDNTRVGIVTEAIPTNFTHEDWREPGHTYAIKLLNSPTIPVSPGTPFYYSSSPGGFPLQPGNVKLPAEGEGGALIITAAQGTELQVRRVGSRPLAIKEAPRPGDSIFIEPTRLRPAVLALWSVIPNMHYFWMVDAVSQNQPIPPRHLVLVTAYAATQIAAFLALGVILFQKRDVG